MNILFDLDGTLVDSVPDIHAAVNQMLEAAGYRGLDLPAVRGFIGEGTEMLTRRVIAAVGADPAQLDTWHRSFLHHYTAVMLRDTRPYPGVAEALAELRARGDRLAVCTNKPAAQSKAILAATGLAPLFNAVVGGDTLPQRKPLPEPLLHASALLGDAPTVFVGDSEIDAAAAEAAGMPLFLFTRGYRKAPIDTLPHLAAFDRFADLPDLIAAISPA
ncbi:phosphoglycolate phosphatase [Pseudochelatococcus sp. B33]